MIDPTIRFAALAILAPLALACDLGGDNDARQPATTAGESATKGDDPDDDGDDGDDGEESGGEDDDGGDDGDDDGGGDGDSGGGADFGFCVHACDEPEDCCFEGVDCGTYPNAWDCNAGACVPLGCASDGDCVYIENTTCQMVGEIGQCLMLCEADADCIVDLGETCSGKTDDDQGFCVIPAPQCGSNEECNGDDSTSFVCTDGRCLCDGNDDCATIGDTCDLDTGLCHCTGNATCPDGFACA